MLILLAVVTAGVYTCDQLSKIWVENTLTVGESIPVIGDALRFHFVLNPGAAFSLASGSTWIFSIIAASVTVFLIWFSGRIRSRAWAVLFGLLLGGTMGNLTDRLFRDPGFGVGHVVDFLSVWGFPAIFNLADVAIVSSMGLFILLTFRGIGLDGSRAASAASKDKGGADGDGTAPRVTPDPL